MRTTDYTPGTLIFCAGETFRYLGEFYAPFVPKKVHMYLPIKTVCRYSPFVGEPEWHASNNIPELAVPFNSKIYGESIHEEYKTCK